MAYYVGVFIPLEAGGWRGLFPDVPACKASGASLDLAVYHAASVLTQYAGSLDGNGTDGLPPPRDLTAIRSDDEWASAHAIDWSRVVVTMVPLPG